MEKLLTAEDVARVLNVSTAWVYDHADRKRPQIIEAMEDPWAGFGADEGASPGEARRVDQSWYGQSSGELPLDATFAEVWNRYTALKSTSWSTATRNAVTSIFAGESAKKDHPNVLVMIGGRPARGLTRDPLQQMLNQMATRGDSYSAVKKARTYLSAAREYARDEKLVTENAAESWNYRRRFSGSLASAITR